MTNRKLMERTLQCILKRVETSIQKIEYRIHCTGPSTRAEPMEEVLYKFKKLRAALIGED